MTITVGDPVIPYQRIACRTEDGQWFDFDRDALRQMSLGIHLQPGFEDLMRKLYKELVLPDVVAQRLMRST